MRSILVHEGYTEEEVKPADLLRQYRALTERDVRDRLSGSARVDRPCPGCGEAHVTDAFERFGLRYVACSACGTLRIAPAPDDASLLDYYRKSEAEAFWRHDLSGSTAAGRRARIIDPRMAWIRDAVAEHCTGASVVADIHINEAAYIPALKGLAPFERVVLVQPFLPASEIPEVPAVEVVDRPLAESGLTGVVDAVTLFEVLDRTTDVDGLMAAVAKVLKADGLCFVTGILASGFEFQVLGNRSRNLLPPDRLNVFTVEGMQALFRRHGFDVVEFSTPGNFDLHTIERALEEDPELPLPPFVTYLIRQRSTPEKLLFQEFLQSALMSAYGRIILKKR